MSVDHADETEDTPMVIDSDDGRSFPHRKARHLRSDHRREPERLREGTVH